MTITTPSCPTLFLRAQGDTLTTISVGALSAALRSVHLPTCENPSHAHYYLREHVPEELPAIVRDKSLIGGCMCLGSVRVACGPHKGQWWLRVDAYERSDHAKPKLSAALWIGTNDAVTGTYKRRDIVAGGRIARVAGTPARVEKNSAS